MTHLDDDLRAIDAQPRVDLTPSETAHADALLAMIVQLDPSTEPTGALAWHRASRPRRGPLERFGLAVGTTLAGGALLAGAAVVGLPLAQHALQHGPGGASSLTSAEIASWSAVPTHPSTSSASIQQIAQECVALVGQSGQEAPGTPTVQDVDRRGSVVTVVVSTPGDGARRWCIAGANGVAASELIDDPTTHLPAVAPGAIDMQTAGSTGDGATAVAEAYGQVGSDVTNVVLHPVHGPAITTLVGDGLWTAWWPASVTGDPLLEASTITWTTRDGATHSGTADGLHIGL
jgi:hypothetical protein